VGNSAGQMIQFSQQITCSHNLVFHSTWAALKRINCREAKVETQRPVRRDTTPIDTKENGELGPGF
jgi:hypothetical protein